MVKTEKATQGKIDSALKNLKKKITLRDEKFATYTETLNGLLGEGDILPSTADKATLKEQHKEIKKLETEIQTNIKSNYQGKQDSYDAYFAESGKPFRYLVGRTHYISTKSALLKAQQPKEYLFPDVPNNQEGDSKDGFGQKGGKPRPIEETKSSLRKPASKPKVEMDVDANARTATEEQKNDLLKSRAMSVYEVTKIKKLISHMEQFHPAEYAEMIDKRDEMIIAHPEYMDFPEQQDRDRLTLYYTERVFKTFDEETQTKITNEIDVPNMRGAKEEPKTQPKAEPKEEPKEEPQSLRRGKPKEEEEESLEEEPQKEGDEPKLKSSDSNNKANAEPSKANSGAETNENKTPKTTPEQPPTTTTIEDGATKFDGKEGETEYVFGGNGGVAGSVGGFKNDVLSQLEPQSEIASKLAEDKKRRRKDVERLIKEINCFHLIYNDSIEMFRDETHNKQKDDAIRKKDKDALIKHHMEMSNAIRQYYKTSDLRVGVVMSAESMFGQSISNMISGHMASGGSALPNSVFKPKGQDPVKNAVAGNVNIRRGGRNTKKPISRLVPKVGMTPDAQKLNEFTPVVDAPMPYVFQTGVRARRQFRDPSLKIKSKR